MHYKSTDPVFFIADSHFGHANIIKYCDRPFKDVKEMDTVMVENWNKIVPKDGIVYHLGDFSFGYAKRYREALNGKIYLLKGNHDKEKESVYKVLFEEYLIYRKIHIDNIPIILFHYPIANWDGKFHGSLHLHGHSHEKETREKNRLNISVELWNYKPITFQQIKEKNDLYVPD